MQELIKGSLKPIIVDGDKPINNRIHKTGKVRETEHRSRGNREADFELDFDEELSETGEPKEHIPVREPEPEPEHEPEYAIISLRELEELREHFRREGEEQAQTLKRKAEIELAKAKEDADNIRKVAENQRLEKLRALEADSAKAMEKAKREGYDAGYGEGLKKGTDDGYVQGLKKCKDTLLDLKNLCDSVEKEKAALVAENRRAIFDMGLSVAEKITMTMFTQRDKQALEKMISEAAKEFRSAKSVRVTLSKLDLSDDVEADLRILEKCFSETVNVEFEVLEDAERGMLLVETESEILDAGVSTQLRMIEELGKGKFRDKEPDDAENAEDIGEAVKTERPKKIRKAAKTKAPEVSGETAAEQVEAANEPVDVTIEPVSAAAQSADVTVEPVDVAAQPLAAEKTAEDIAEEQEATEEQ